MMPMDKKSRLIFCMACLACTGQREFYDDAYGQKVSIDFLHDYILGNYRRLYAQTLAAGINHFNQGQIILKLLATGRQTLPEHRDEENALITAALRALPPQRAWRVLAQLRQQRINNRRSRAIAHDYLTSHGERLAFQAVKYRSKMRVVTTHNHLNLQDQLQGELGLFLFRHWPSRFQTELLEQFRQGYYSAKALYNLPFTIAEGLASRHRIPRDRFLTQIESTLTVNEKLRLQTSAEQVGKTLEIDWHRISLTRLALYLLSKSPAEREAEREPLQQAWHQSARSVLRRAPMHLGRVAAVLDCSYSSSGSSEKRRRPLAIAIGVHYLLQAAAAAYQPFWTIPVADPLLITPRGQTNLATPLLQALSWQPDLVVILSDAWENDPPDGAQEVLRIYRSQLDPNCRVSIVHGNPVFNAEDFTLRRLSPLVPTVGLREAEDLPTMLSFARFAEGTAPLAELNQYLATRAQALLQRVSQASAQTPSQVLPQEVG